MPWGLTANDIQNIIMAITALVVAIDTLWTKMSHTVNKQTQADVQELKNGALKEKVQEAIVELPNVHIHKTDR